MTIIRYLTSTIGLMDNGNSFFGGKSVEKMYNTNLLPLAILSSSIDLLSKDSTIPIQEVEVDAPLD